MFYEYNDELIAIDAESISQNFLSTGYVQLRELNSLYDDIGVPYRFVMMCHNSHKYYSVEVGEDCVYGVMNIINPAVASSDNDRIGFFASRNMVIVVELFDEDCSVRDRFLSAVHRYDPTDIDAQKLCFAIFDSLLDGDNDFMQDMEEYVDSLEQRVLNNNEENSFNQTLLGAKNQLQHMHNYYNSVEDIAFTFLKNDVIGGNDAYFELLIGRVKRLKDNLRMLSDSIVHLREAYHSSLEIRQNNIMKVMTLYTVVFSPLSFIVGWYGMNFDMPELKWRLGYVFVILVAVLVVLFLLIFFKYKKWI